MAKWVWFRVEGNAHIGTGHVSRCLTLARQLQKRGVRIGVLATADTLKRMKPKLPDACWQVVSKTQSEQLDAHSSIATLRRQPCDLLVVDCYALSWRWESMVKPYVHRLMAIDDLARGHECDLLLDQNYHPGSHRYRRKIPRHAQQLLGPRYALMREGIHRLMPTLMNDQNKMPKHLFICFGGSDPVCATALTLQALQEIKHGIVGCDVVIGRHYPDIESLQKLCSVIPGAVLHINHPAPEQLMHRAQFSIGAGGVMMWERAAAGLPGLVISIAENQREGCMAMEKAGMIEYLGHYDRVDSSMLAKRIDEAIQEYSKRYDMARKAQYLVDGRGAWRVVKRMLHARF